MAKTNVNTAYESTCRMIAAQVEKLHSVAAERDAEALENKLSATGFSEAEKVCVRMINRTSGEWSDSTASELEATWNAHQLAIEAASLSALEDAEITGDFRWAIRLQELASMADSCVMTYAR